VQFSLAAAGLPRTNGALPRSMSDGMPETVETPAVPAAHPLRPLAACSVLLRPGVAAVPCRTCISASIWFCAPATTTSRTPSPIGRCAVIGRWTDMRKVNTGFCLCCGMRALVETAWHASGLHRQGVRTSRPPRPKHHQKRAISSSVPPVERSPPTSASRTARSNVPCRRAN
jgi:hypothetical protein